MSDPTLDAAYADDVNASLYGEKGGKGGGGSARTPVEEPNTLRSTSLARVVDLISEGPIVGLANGLKSVYLDDTPLQNEDDSTNFSGVVVSTRDGEPDQSHIPGFPAVETAQDVSVELTAATPIVRTISNGSVDAVRVTVQVPALSFQDPETGDLRGDRVAIAIDVRPSGGDWSERRADIIEGKTTSPYQRSYRVDLVGSAPWDIRLRRTTPDSEEANRRNQTYWATYTEIIDAKLTYPDSALVGLEVDAQQFGTQIPSRAYDIKGLIIKVPSNYDPETREYTGLWDGSFKLAWTDNPAWVFYDLATNDRYGVGLTNVDKWSLYEIGRYCDELVPNGYGEQEPRFTFNSQMASQTDAYKALGTLASAFRGMTYWGTNTVMPVADMPADPVKLVGPANVIGGDFERQGSALKARHSVALVTWNDPEDNYRKQVEVVEDSDAVQRFGWRKTDVTAAGCTSRGQAHRVGKWVLDSERSETETITYQASVDHADLRPGDIIAVSDPARAATRNVGRLTVTGTQRLRLDRVPDDRPNDTWYLDAMLPSGGIERRVVADFDGDWVTLDAPLSAEPVSGGMWMLSSASVEPELFRVLSVEEQDDNVFTVTALQHDPTKYARVEQGIYLPERETSLVPTGPVVGPLNITAESYTYLAGGTEHQAMTVSWTPSDDARVVSYIAEVQGPNDVQWRTAYNGSGTSFDLYDIAPGEWQIRVRGITGTGTPSPWAFRTTTIASRLEPVPPESIDITTGTFTITLIPSGGRPNQEWEFWRSTVALTDELIESNAVRVGVATSLQDNELSPATTYFYYVRGVNAYGVSDWYPVQATTEADPAKIMSVISGEIRKTDLFSELASNIDALNNSWVIKVDGNGNVGGIGLAYDDEQNVIDFGIRADRMYIVDPDDPLNEDLAFIFEDGTLYLKEALIQSLTFTKLRASDGSLIFQDGKLQAEYIAVDQLETNTLTSTKTVNGRPAYAFREDGTFELNASSSGGRTVQDGNGVRVYDQNGTLRVNMGLLS